MGHFSDLKEEIFWLECYNSVNSSHQNALNHSINKVLVSDIPPALCFSIDLINWTIFARHKRRRPWRLPVGFFFIISFDFPFFLAIFHSFVLFNNTVKSVHHLLALRKWEILLSWTKQTAIFNFKISNDYTLLKNRWEILFFRIIFSDNQRAPEFTLMVTDFQSLHLWSQRLLNAILYHEFVKTTNSWLDN